MGHEPLTKYVVLFVTLLQLSLAYKLRHTAIFSPLFLLTAYIIGGTANQNTFLAIHEITHNLAFRGVKANRVMAIGTNFIIGVPFAMMFKKYHIEHHKVCLLSLVAWISLLVQHRKKILIDMLLELLNSFWRSTGWTRTCLPS